jgi:putative glutathione S-transferase
MADYIEDSFCSIANRTKAQEFSACTFEDRPNQAEGSACTTGNRSKSATRAARAKIDTGWLKALWSDVFPWAQYQKILQNLDNVDLYPLSLRERIIELNDALFNELSSSVYSAATASDQGDYEKAFDSFFVMLSELETRLSKQRYLLGDSITDPDIRLYTILVRLDVVYYSIFRLNLKRLTDFPSLWEYARELYQIPGFGDTTDFASIKRGYFLGSLERNPYQISALGPDLSGWVEPHNRDRINGGL